MNYTWEYTIKPLFELCIAIALFCGVIALVSGLARWLGCPRWLAVCIPNVPLGLLLAFCVVFNIQGAGEGGAMACWIEVAFLLVFALPTSLITVFIVRKRHGNKSSA
jgi:hypothetical protein